MSYFKAKMHQIRFRPESCERHFCDCLECFLQNNSTVGCPASGHGSDVTHCAIVQFIVLFAGLIVIHADLECVLSTDVKWKISRWTYRTRTFLSSEIRLFDSVASEVARMSLYRASTSRTWSCASDAPTSHDLRRYETYVSGTSNGWFSALCATVRLRVRLSNFRPLPIKHSRVYITEHAGCHRFFQDVRP